MDDLASYIADNYGECAAVRAGMPCACLKNGWRGRFCVYWEPTSARTWDELNARQIPT